MITIHEAIKRLDKGSKLLKKHRKLFVWIRQLERDGGCYSNTYNDLVSESRIIERKIFELFK